MNKFCPTCLRQEPQDSPDKEAIRLIEDRLGNDDAYAEKVGRRIVLMLQLQDADSPPGKARLWETYVGRKTAKGIARMMAHVFEENL